MTVNLNDLTGSGFVVVDSKTEIENSENKQKLSGLEQNLKDQRELPKDKAPRTNEDIAKIIDEFRAQYENDKAASKKENAALKKDNATLKKDNELFKKTIERKDIEFETLKKEHECFKNENNFKIQALVKDLECFKKDNEQKLQESKSKENKLKDLNTLKDRQIELLKLDKHDLEKQIEDLNKEIKGLNKEISKEERFHQGLNNALEENIKGLEIKIQHMGKENLGLKETINELSPKVVQQNDEIQKLNDEIAVYELEREENGIQAMKLRMQQHEEQNRKFLVDKTMTSNMLKDWYNAVKENHEVVQLDADDPQFSHQAILCMQNAFQKLNDDFNRQQVSLNNMAYNLVRAGYLLQKDDYTAEEVQEAQSQALEDKAEFSQEYKNLLRDVGLPEDIAIQLFGKACLILAEKAQKDEDIVKANAAEINQLKQEKQIAENRALVLSNEKNAQAQKINHLQNQNAQLTNQKTIAEQNDRQAQVRAADLTMKNGILLKDVKTLKTTIEKIWPEDRCQRFFTLLTSLTAARVLPNLDYVGQVEIAAAK